MGDNRKMIDKRLQDELRARFNPDGSELRKMQLRMLEILHFIDEICKKNNIKYWLSSGTCLGAVRHSGFIPWDDDVDVEMMPKDYKKFCKVLEGIRSTDYALQTHETDFEYVAPYAKLRDLHSEIKETNNNDRWYKYKGLYVDVFPVYIFSSEVMNKLSWILQLVLLHKLTSIDNKKIRQGLLKLNYGLLYNGIFPLFNLFNKFWKKRIIRVGGLGSGFSDRYDKDIADEIIEIVFEDAKFPVLKQYDRYLSSLYGEYMELPQFSSIHPHTNNIIIE